MPFSNSPPGPFWLHPFISAPQALPRPSRLISITNGWSHTPLISGLPSGMRGAGPGAVAAFFFTVPGAPCAEAGALSHGRIAHIAIAVIIEPTEFLTSDFAS